MYILGLPGIHNPSWSLIKDGKPIIHIDRERLTRIKDKNHILANDNSLIDLGLKYCLESEKIGINDIAYMVHTMNPYAVKCDENFLKEDVFLEWVFREQRLFNDLVRKKYNYKNEFVYVKHHLAHAAGVYFCSPFEESAILTLDGRGEQETIALNYAEGVEIRRLEEIILPHSLGNFYTKITELLGWKLNQEGKTMGLAPFGDYEDKLRYFDLKIDKKIQLIEKWEEKLKKMIPRGKNEEVMNKKFVDLAAQAQFEVEEIVIKIAKYLYKKTKTDNLCLNGGVALNSVMNKKILDRTKFKNIFILPGAGDSGVQMGGALYCYYEVSKCLKKKKYYMKNAYLGKDYSESCVKKTLKKYKDKLSYKQYNNEDIEKKCAHYIKDEMIVGWFQGKSEFGPRALGNRSILANAQNKLTKDILNKKVKFREPFRPFAPIILEEYLEEYFDLRCPSPFMLFVAEVKKNKKNSIPSAIHIDNTARIQTVNKKDNKKIYNVINEYRKITNIPVLINTSFNLSGEPIVETPEDAIKCFLNSKIDILFIHNYLIRRK